MLHLAGRYETAFLFVHACNMLDHTLIVDGETNLVPVALLTKSPASRKFSMLFRGVCNESAMSEAIWSQSVRTSVVTKALEEIR
jgi:hypothetical protein